MKRVLIVDSDTNLAFFLAETLTELGPNTMIQICHSANEALYLSQQQPYDLIITDMNLLDTSGLRLIQLLNHHPPKRDYILITPYEYTNSKPPIIGIDTVHHINKPFQVEHLLSLVETVLQTSTITLS